MLKVHTKPSPGTAVIVRSVGNFIGSMLKAYMRWVCAVRLPEQKLRGRHKPKVKRLFCFLFSSSVCCICLALVGIMADNNFFPFFRSVTYLFINE